MRGRVWESVARSGPSSALVLPSLWRVSQQTGDTPCDLKSVYPYLEPVSIYLVASCRRDVVIPWSELSAQSITWILLGDATPERPSLSTSSNISDPCKGPSIELIPSDAICLFFRQAHWMDLAPNVSVCQAWSTSVRRRGAEKVEK